MGFVVNDGQALWPLTKPQETAEKNTRRHFLAGLGAAALLSVAGVEESRGADLPRLADWGGMELLDSNNNAFKVHQLEKPFTLIVVWANWCSKCMRELPTIANLPHTMGGSNLELILVSHPDDWMINQRVVAQHNLGVRCARPSTANDPVSLRRAFVNDDGIFYVPHSILFSRQHQAVVWNHIGVLDYSNQSAMTPVRKWLPA